ncbi:hypothetical protein WJX81_006366 [Elliptochloris bilobata]|uniref:Queuosine 5'-phosphate N-glycosylase/hydrolase n=1 Tax=Elliptochloris bilobata TaxID=381761 RepID=A0AAW1QUN6_9CHLO
MPGIPAGSVLQQITRACDQIASESTSELRIDDGALQAYANALDPAEVRAAAEQSRLPIRFDNEQSEVNLMALQRLLDFGSGYEPLLAAATGRSARETMQFGVIGLHISGQALDAAFLGGLSAFALASYFGFPAQQDSQLQPGIYISRPGPLAGLSERMRAVLHGAGAALASAGVADLGALVLQLVDARRSSRQPVNAAALVTALAEAVPGFADYAQWRGQAVPLHRKAAGLAGDLAARFGTEDPRFAFADAADLPADSGNALQAPLRYLGILRLSEPLARAVDAGEDMPPGPQETALRAAAVAACARVAAAAPGGVTAHQVGAYLLARTSGETGLPPGHLTRDTAAY